MSLIYLHATVINNYVFIFDFGVQLCHLSAALQEQAIGQFPINKRGN